jgi:hypothetical protein
VVLAIGHALRAHEALSRSDALAGLPEVVHRPFENGVFVGHDGSIRAPGGRARANQTLGDPYPHGQEKSMLRRVPFVSARAVRSKLPARPAS